MNSLRLNLRDSAGIWRSTVVAPLAMKYAVVDWADSCSINRTSLKGVCHRR